MNRRSSLGAFGALATAALATASAPAAAQHDHHAHHGGSAPAAGPRRYRSLQRAAAICVSDGQTCLAHCLQLLATGDKGMADCAKNVSQMLALCNALQSLAAQESGLTSGLAKVAQEACARCADACKPHIDHHAECRACYESCLECIKECKAASA